MSNKFIILAAKRQHLSVFFFLWMSGSTPAVEQAGAKDFEDGGLIFYLSYPKLQSGNHQKTSPAKTSHAFRWVNVFFNLPLVKENPELAAMKIIFLSAKNKKEAIEKGIVLGADHCFTKPFSVKTQ